MTLFDQVPRPVFDGETYSTEHDEVRLKGQLLRVFTLMRDGEWRTLDEIGRAVRAPGASVSARLRDLRKRKFGGHKMERRHRGLAGDGLYEYRLTVNESPALYSEQLKTGTRVQHRDGSVVTLKCRKGPDERPGWWLEEGGGLADDVLDNDNQWTIL